MAHWKKLTLDNTRSQAKPKKSQGTGEEGFRNRFWSKMPFVNSDPCARTGTKNPESPWVYLVPVLLSCAFLSQVKKGQRTVEEGLRNGSLSKRPCLNRD